MQQQLFCEIPLRAIPKFFLFKFQKRLELFHLGLKQSLSERAFAHEGSQLFVQEKTNYFVSTSTGTYHYKTRFDITKHIGRIAMPRYDLWGHKNLDIEIPEDLFPDETWLEKKDVLFDNPHHGYFESCHEGKKLHYRRNLPSEKPVKAIIIFQHGM